MDLALLVVLALCAIPLVVFTSGAFTIAAAVALLVFVPGYALVSALFPKRDSLQPVERLAFSLILSIAIVPMIGLILHYTPWGIRTYPITGILSVFIIVCSLVALLRRRALPKEERFEPRIHLSVPHLGGGTRLDKALVCVLLLTVLGAVGTLAYVVAVPKNVEEFSEFYLLGADGMMEEYPQEAIVGRPVYVTVGIINREQKDTTYAVEIMIGGDSMDQIGPFLLSRDNTWEDRVAIVPSKVGLGPDQRVEVKFLLRKNGGTEPYLSLHIMLDVREEA
jgi:uncharacterized membrane protein